MANHLGWKFALIIVGLFIWISSTLIMHEIISPPATVLSFVDSRSHIKPIISDNQLQLNRNTQPIVIKHEIESNLRGANQVHVNTQPQDHNFDQPERKLAVVPSPPQPPPPPSPQQKPIPVETPILKTEEPDDDMIQKFNKLNSGCDMIENIDYPILNGAKEIMVENLSLEDCCMRCHNNNFDCEVAVYSSGSDSPPQACWLKSKVDNQNPIYKDGVKSCIKTLSKTNSISDNVMKKYVPDIIKLLQKNENFLLPRKKGEVYDLLPPLHAHNEDISETKSTEDTREDTDEKRISVLTHRAEAIKNAMSHCWRNYREHAWGMDNVSPISGRGSNGGFNHAVTMVDSLDTLWLMGMNKEFDEAKEWLRKNMKERISHLGGGTSLFETTIRSFGGLLSAYDMSKDKLFLELSVLMANKISAKTSQDGVSPYTFSGGSGGMGCPSLAESGTMQVEMNFMSKVSGDPHYAEKANRFYRTVKSRPNLDGLYPNCWQRGRGRITFGADGDSFYEYLIKGWLQTGRKDDNLWRMYNKAIDGMQKWLVIKSRDGLTYLNNLDFDGKEGGRSDNAMEHLACFVPGWLALGIPYQTDSERKAKHLKLAEELAYTCWQFYDAQPSGIGPERVKGLKIDLSQTDTKEYILRPEAIEGWWYMYELTGNDMYREWGWKTFNNFEKYLKAPHGYASLRNVRSPDSGKMDRMESFFMAETLKYLYLLQDHTRPIRLDTHVFNTEAHPFSIN